MVTMKKLMRSLAEPQALSALMVTAYTVIVAFGFRLIPYLNGGATSFWEWVPATLMLTAAPIGAVCAWKGHRRAERIALILTGGGLAGGIYIETIDLWGSHFASEVMVLLGTLLGLAAAARYVYLGRSLSGNFHSDRGDQFHRVRSGDN